MGGLVVGRLTLYRALAGSATSATARALWSTTLCAGQNAFPPFASGAATTAAARARARTTGVHRALAYSTVRRGLRICKNLIPTTISQTTLLRDGLAAYCHHHENSSTTLLTSTKNPVTIALLFVCASIKFTQYLEATVLRSIFTLLRRRI